MNDLMLTVLLAEDPNHGPDFGKASPVGLLVVVLLLIAVFLLVWSMNKHLKKVPESFDPPEPAVEAPSETATEAPAETSEAPQGD